MPAYEGNLRDRFTVGEVEFVVDITAGKNRRPSEPNSFTIVKSNAMLNFYLAMADRTKATSILELGVFQGGSLVLLDQLFQPDTLIGIEIDPPFDALTSYCAAQDRNVNVYFETSQADEQRLVEIIQREFPEGIDLILDDASHTYEFTRKSLEIAWPFLKPGGSYVIEDWAWSHKAAHQNPAVAWHSKPALTNLLFELIIDLGTSVNIRSISIDAGRALITKGNTDQIPLDKSMLRGRDFNLI